MTNKEFGAFAAGLAAISLVVSACGGSASDAGGTKAAPKSEAKGSIDGSGASSQQNAQQAWRDNFKSANPDITINYTANGSGNGRAEFLAGKSQYAGSDSAMKAEELKQVANVCKTEKAVELPVYISPIAIAVNIEGVKELNLTGETIAKIFAGQITQWDDPAIKESNPKAKLPSAKIIPINRAEKSGTTKNFQEYLKTVAPSVWTHKPEETWPISGTQSAEKTSGVVTLAESTPNSIIYADFSQIKKLTPVKVGVGKSFIGPEAEAAAKIVDHSPASKDATDTLLSKDFKRDGSIEGGYPVVMVSYLIGCQEYKDANHAKIVKDFFSYVISKDGQEAAHKANGGNAPISDKLREESQKVVDTIK
ncbi:phosphate ABC transporter substrate-binding protein PstS [Actinotignum urinale]|uniref:phosphate ABC transporter substrate-binding protein PstS n=1 Tax=Actinotignum urinale TaxID=190146 RepID=UPI00280A6227|nr:phosphate ABC transporter substrate-binding protein PstS [Actinotignum urinale]